MLNAFRLTRWRNKKVGDATLRLTLVSAVAGLVISVHSTIKKDNSSGWQVQRAQIKKLLKQENGEHLVVVSYGPGHSVHNEWIYNEADIDRSKVVFARAINNPQDCQLVEYFKSRRTWSLDADQSIPKLEPYPRNQCK